MDSISSGDSQREAATPLTYIFLFAPFIGLCALMIASGKASSKAPEAIDLTQQVDVVPVVITEQYQQRKVAVGRVESKRQAALGFELSGTLATVLVDEGQAVRKGDTIAKLDTTRLEAQKKELNASLTRAKSQQRLAVLSESRIIDLVNRELESPQRLDEVRETTISAKAQVDEILARIESLEVLLQQSTLTAPFDAVVIDRPTDPGTVLSPGQAILTLSSLKTIDARIPMAADDAFALNVGDSATLTMDNASFDARVIAIARQRDLSTRTVDVIFELFQKGNALLPGDIVAFSYTKTFDASGTWIPNSALSSGTRGLWNVYVTAAGKTSNAQMRTVEVLYTTGEYAYVKGGIRDGDLLIVDGTHRIVSGQRVIPREQLPLARSPRR